MVSDKAVEDLRSFENFVSLDSTIRQRLEYLDYSLLKLSTGLASAALTD
jgi:hypothetical protein